MEEQILYEPFPKQKEFLKAALSGQYKYILYGGAIRGGKTFGGLGTLLILASLYPYSKWAIVRDALPTLKRNTIPSFSKICPQNFIKNYNQDTQTVTFTNGSQFIFFAENYDDDKELNRWKGLEVSGFLLEEANELQEVSFYKAIERAGSHIPKAKYKKPKPLILLTCNPSWSWVKTLFYDRHKSGTLPQDYKYIPAKITDNPIILQDQDYMDSLKNMPNLQYEIFVEGDWEINLNENPWLYTFVYDKHVGNAPVMYDYPVYLSFDFNIEPFCCVAAQHSQQRGNAESFIHFVKEFLVSGEKKINIEDMCMAIKNYFPSNILYVTGDRNGSNEEVGVNKTRYEIIQGLLGLSDKQMHVNTRNLEHSDSRILCNTMLHNYPHFVIDRTNCPTLIQECQKAVVDEFNRNPSHLLKDRGTFKMDLFDGMRYYFQTYWNEWATQTYFKSKTILPVWHKNKPNAA